MKIKDLPKFLFYIGNTLDEEYDVIATNEGIEIEGEVSSPYDEDMELDDVNDFMELIDDAIATCDSLTDDDKEELGVVLYNGADLNIKTWWDEKVFN